MNKLFLLGRVAGLPKKDIKVTTEYPLDEDHPKWMNNSIKDYNVFTNFNYKLYENIKKNKI